MRDQIGRRHFLTLAGAAAVATAVVPEARATSRLGELFTLGVASGDPQPDGVVLWTRLAPEPTAPDGHGGMPAKRYQVTWEIAEDPRFRRIVRRGVEHAVPEWAHSVHAEVHGLRPDREYWHRFVAGDQISPVGRTRTAPAWHSRLNGLTLDDMSIEQLEAELGRPLLAAHTMSEVARQLAAGMSAAA